MFRSLVASFAVAILAGCGSSTTALIDAARQQLRPAAAETAALNPALTYLRLTNGKAVALLVLGYLDDEPQPGTAVWYSGDKAAIRLWRGRLAGTGGLDTDWRAVRFGDVPTWRSALSAPARYRRERDVMPGYAIAVREDVEIVHTTAPAKSALAGMATEDIARLTWFEERTVPLGQAGGLPVARFAVDLSGAVERVVYSEQCLSAALCLTFQIWPAPVVAAAAARQTLPR